jgi:DeoR family fructose operon transcriptional repressor
MNPVCSENKFFRLVDDGAKTTSRSERESLSLHDGSAMRIADDNICPALPVKRHREILRLLGVQTQLTIREVADCFNISVDTARRDLDLLARQGLLNRTYGGAVVPEKLPSQSRRSLPQVDIPFEKGCLAQSLDQLIRDGETILLNGAFTTRYCAEALGGRQVGIVTNSLDLPFELITRADVFVLGGKCRPGARATVGPMTVSGITIKVDWAVIGVDGIMANEGLSANLLEEALMASEMIAAARRTIVMAVASKFGKRSFARIGPIESMQVLITNEEPPADLAQALREAHVQVVISRTPEMVGSFNGHPR